MSESEAEEDDMIEIEQPDDLMTLNQFQHGLCKEMLARKGPQTMVSSPKKGRVYKGKEPA